MTDELPHTCDIHFVYAENIVKIYHRVNWSGIVFHLEKEKKIHELIIANTMDGLSLNWVNVKCNNKLLFTCCSFGQSWQDSRFPYSAAATLITARQMPCDSQVPSRNGLTGYRWAQNSGFVLSGKFNVFRKATHRFVFRYCEAYIIAMEPLRIMRKWEEKIPMRFLNLIWNKRNKERQNIGTGGGWKVNKEILIQIITISPKSK